MLTNHAFDSLPVPDAREIAMASSVPNNQVDPICSDQSHYVEPEAVALKPTPCSEKYWSAAVGPWLSEWRYVSGLVWRSCGYAATSFSCKLCIGEMKSAIHSPTCQKLPYHSNPEH